MRWQCVADYNEANLDDYNIKLITRKVRVIEDASLTAQSPAVRGARVTIYLKDGDVYENTCLYHKGEPEYPLTQEELELKFCGLAMYGGLSKNDCDDVIEVVKNEFDVNRLLHAVRKL